MTVSPRARLSALLLIPLLAACGSEDPKLAEAREIGERPIVEIVGSDQVKLSKHLSRRRVACPEMYGVPADRAESEFLLFCADQVTPDMRDNFTHPGWTVYSLFLGTQELRPGNHTMHCAVVPSSRDVCTRL